MKINKMTIVVLIGLALIFGGGFLDTLYFRNSEVNFYKWCAIETGLVFLGFYLGYSYRDKIETRGKIENEVIQNVTRHN